MYVFIASRVSWNGVITFSNSAALKEFKMSDKELYQIIADELKTKNIDTALWIQAKETAGGDPDKTEAAYIRLRFLDLIKSSLPLPKSISLVNNTRAEVKPKDDGLSRMRTELAKKLLNQGKHSLYSTLKLHPDTSDAVIATAIGDLESKNLVGSDINPAEFKYAKETLSNPDLREQYDRQLLGSISNNITKPYRSYPVEEMYNEYSWWESSKTSIIIGVLSLVLFGYLGLNYLKERNGNEIQKVAVESQKEAVHTISDATQMRTQADIDFRTEQLRLAAERQNQDMAFRTRAVDQMFDQQRMMQESRMQADQQRQKAQQDQAENLRAMKEKQYWACMNQQLSQRDGNSYNADVRCARYH
jgi:hypothetical protein